MNKKRACRSNRQALKEVRPLLEGYTPYGYLGEVNGRLIEVVSESELYELLEDDDVE